MASVREEAKRLAGLGFNPLPTRRGKKAPGLPSWRKFQKESSADMVDSWWGTGSGYVGIWTCTGSVSSLVVLDCDSEGAETFWRSLIAPELDATACVKTAKGAHYWFALPPGRKVESWAIKEGAIAFDVKAEGGGVMTPPSPHPDGGFYSWVRDVDHILPAPSWLLDGGKAVKKRMAGHVDAEPSDTGGEEPLADTTRTMLSHLLNHKPDVGGRNEWLTRVAGHYAKSIPFENAYVDTMRLVNRSLTSPLDEAEFVKTISSVWNAEKAKGLGTIEDLQERGIVSGEPSDVNGWLVGTSTTLLAPALIGEKDNRELAMQEWANFDVKTLGVIKGQETTDYLVQLNTIGGTVECKLEGKVLGSVRDLTIWLAARQASIVPPTGDTHPRVSVASRLLRYVTSQDAPVYQSVSSLGWNDDAHGFITHQGIIRAGDESAAPFGDLRPSPTLTEWAPYHYGFVGDRETAKTVLREVMTFHDETVTAIYGAWWAACFVKPQLMARTALFPFMALEAPSESGKTTGFFALMMQLAGNREGHGEYTMAVLRDRVSAHHNGPVWIDDVTDPAGAFDLIRQATSGGSRSKKAENRHSQETVTLVAPITMSAEGMHALSTEKALSDRAIVLPVPSPIGRRSLKDKNRSQWDDITELMLQWRRDLTQLAGWYVSMALEVTDWVDDVVELRPNEAGGRFNDTMAVLRVGARILEHMGVPGVRERVDAWVEERSGGYDPSANLLTKAVLPWAWRDANYPRSALYGQLCFVDANGVMWYREEALADAWQNRRSISERERQLGSLESLRDQRGRITGSTGPGRPMSVAKGGHSKARYHGLTEAATAAVIAASGWGGAVDQESETVAREGDLEAHGQDAFDIG